jgi:GT2 family glycosyltransferase
MPEPIVTIVVVPREYFSRTQESLESIYEHTDFPFKLVYVDGNSPAQVRRYLEAQAQARKFQLVRTNYYLSPNHARNIGLKQVNTKYLVFVDNDVIVSPGWLTALVKCAEETGATIVGPLMCQYEPVHEIIHFAGGEAHIVTDTEGQRHFREKIYKQNQRVVDLHPTLQRTQTELAEFHCVLVRTEVFEQIGPLDEAMLNTREHEDLCMTVAAAGGTIYFEPEAIATFVPAPPLHWTDMHFYMLRWSDAWTMGSLNRLREKWNLSEDGYFQTQYKKLGWRRKVTIIKPLSRRLAFGLGQTRLTKLLFNLDKKFNRYLTDRYAQAQIRRSSEQSKAFQLSTLQKPNVEQDSAIKT